MRICQDSVSTSQVHHAHITEHQRLEDKYDIPSYQHLTNNEMSENRIGLAAMYEFPPYAEFNESPF